MLTRTHLSVVRGLLNDPNATITARFDDRDGVGFDLKPALAQLLAHLPEVVTLPKQEGYAVVLLSGGLDSTISLHWAHHTFGHVCGFFVDYGQKGVDAEARAAAKVAADLDAPFYRYSLPIGQICEGSSLTGEAELDSRDTGYIPARNAFLLTAAAMFAAIRCAKHLVIGVSENYENVDPDGRRVFVDASERMLETALYPHEGPMRIHAPLMGKTKVEALAFAKQLGCWAALAHSVTCFNGKHGGCGTCVVCGNRRRAFEAFGEADPACEST